MLVMSVMRKGVIMKMNRAQRRAAKSKKGGKYYGLNKNRQDSLGRIKKDK